MAFVVDHMWVWARLSLSGQEHGIPPAWAYWHARLMVLGWSVLLPLGMMIARFLKVWPGQPWPEVLDNPRWWRSHVWLQILGIATMTAGLGLVLGHAHGTSPLAIWHHRGGWLLVSIGWLQVTAALLRGTKGGPTVADLRGDHYDMTPRRLLFEYVHKFLGWAALPVVVATTSAGLVLLDAPRWMLLLLGAWWAGLAVAFVCLQRSGWCVDTYQAIWGADPIHPGNGRKPIGWRVTRHPHGAALVRRGLRAGDR